MPEPLHFSDAVTKPIMEYLEQNRLRALGAVAATVGSLGGGISAAVESSKYEKKRHDGLTARMIAPAVATPLILGEAMGALTPNVRLALMYGGILGFGIGADLASGENPGKALTTNVLAGMAGLAMEPFMEKGAETLLRTLEDNLLVGEYRSIEGVLGALGKIKKVNPFLDRLISKKGLGMFAAMGIIPVAHNLISRAIGASRVSTKTKQTYTYSGSFVDSDVGEANVGNEREEAQEGRSYDPGVIHQVYINSSSRTMYTGGQIKEWLEDGE